MQSRIHLFFAFAAMTLVAACGDDSSTSPDTNKAPVGQKGFTLISPNGGETVQVGKPMLVRWNAWGMDSGMELVGTVKIRLGCRKDAWYPITDESIPNELADTLLVIPDSVYDQDQKKIIPTPTGNTCKVMIQDYSNTYYYDTSDVSITVTAP